MNQKRTNSRKKRDRRGILFISPWLFGFTVFVAGPMLFSLFLSFNKWTYMKDMKFVGLDNYVRILTKDPNFIPSILRTLQFAVFAVILQVSLGILIANLFNRKMRYVKFFRAFVYVPCVLSGSVHGLLWSNMLNTEFGVFNYFLTSFGVEKIGWVTDPKLAMWSVIMTSIWAAGMPMVMFLAAMQNIPAHYYEAADIDGAGGFHKFTKITLPMISSTVLFVVILQLIGSFTVMAQVLVLTNGGPAKATYLYSLLVYDNAFNFIKMGYASALSWLMFIIIMSITLIILKTSSRWVYYEEKGGNI